MAGTENRSGRRDRYTARYRLNGELPLKNLVFISKRFWRYRWLLLCAAILTAVSCAAELALPRIMADIVNEGLLERRVETVQAGGAAMLITAFVLGLAGFGTFIACAAARERFALELRGELYEKITALSVAQVEAIGAGPLITRLTGDTNLCASLAEIFLQMLLEPVLLLIGGVVMMWRISHAFDAVFLAFIALECTLVLLFVYKTMPLFLNVLEKNDRINGFLQSELRCLRLIKAYGGGARESAAFENFAEEIRASQMRVRNWTALFDPLILLVVNSAVVCILLLSGLQATAGGLRAGSILEAMTYAQQVLLSIVVSGRLFSQVAEARASAGRLAEVLCTEPSIIGGEMPVPPDGIGRLVLRDVSFRYPSVGAPVLSGLDLTLERGAFVAVCGSAGCGKTTLSRLLCRVCDPTSGQILADGTDLRSYCLDGVRRSIAVVEKNMDIIEGTIAENILYGRTDIPEADVQWALEITGAAQLVRALPEGWDAWARSLGATLSGGDRQRLALARALAGRPSVLVMDDCTSSLDYTTEGAVLRSIRRNCPNLTVILMTQRVPSVQGADLVVCIDEDGKARSGTAEQLRESSPLFALLCRSQEGIPC